MTVEIKAHIAGIQRMQDANAKRMALLQPRSGLGRAIRDATTKLHRYAVSITHVDTGTLRAAHRMDYSESGGIARGRIFIDPNAVNPKSKRKASLYGPFEEARGGSHAFYGRTISERGAQIMREAAEQLRREVANP